MSISTEITKLNTNLTNSYTACSNKGATLPASQNFDNLATCIGSIPSGGSGLLESIMADVVAGNNPVDTSDLEQAEEDIAGLIPYAMSTTKTITENGTYAAIDDDANGYSSVTVNVDTRNNTNITVTPSTTSQTLSPSSPYTGYGTVTVNAVTSAIDSDIVAGNIKSGVNILGVTGNYSGITPTGTYTITANGTYDVTNYASANVSVSSGGKYQLLQRVKSDNNEDVGIVSGFFTDANDTEYAVVCLDAVDRTTANFATWCTNQSLVTNLPAYPNQTLWTAKETATFNTQKILDFLSGNYTSTACTFCRAKDFVIDGITYYGQLPNIIELVDIFRHRIEINSSDPTASSSSNKIIPTATIVWSSSQVDATLAFMVNENGTVGRTSKNYARMAIPVLEIPNT